MVAGAASCSAPAARSGATVAPLPTAPSTTTPSTTPERAAATPPPSTAAPAAVGYTDTTPPPAIRATGTDYAAIADSLFTYLDWVYAHRPDIELASRAIQRGTTVFENAEADLETLRSK